MCCVVIIFFAFNVVSKNANPNNEMHNNNVNTRTTQLITTLTGDAEAEEDESTFWMEWSDFRRQFTQVTLTHILGDISGEK